DRRDEQEERQEGRAHLVASLDDRSRDGRPHDRRARRAKARAGLHLRIDGGTQAGRVRADAHVPRTRAGGTLEHREVTMEARATVRYVRITPTKARRAIDLVRGHQVEEARRILRFSPLSASRTIEKALNS